MLPESSVTPIQSDLDIVTTRSIARDIAKSIGFSAIDQARIATAVSELARNVFLYAGKGQVSIRKVERGGRKGIEFKFQDEGPGIEDISKVMQDGYTTSRGMGMGLPGAKRLMDDFEIESTLGVGTTIICRKWRP